MPLDATPTVAAAPTRAQLDAVPPVDLATEIAAALASGRNALQILGDAFAAWRGPGRLSPAEYLYYRLWDPALSPAERLTFVGKQAQHAMHLACNVPEYYAAAADKLLFHSIMRGAGLPVAELLAHTGADRSLSGVRHLPDAAAVEALLQDPANYPLFAKPVDGKYSLAVTNADRLDDAGIAVVSRDTGWLAPARLAGQLAAPGAGFLLQRRLAPDAGLATAFGPRLWSVRLLVLVGPDGPALHSATAKIAVGGNPADNFWRPGNMLAAIDAATGRITRTLRGTGAVIEVDLVHPDTGSPVTGTVLPAWDDLTQLVLRAARLLPGIRTQSWDVALSDRGPVLLEVNWGGDLNVHQLAHGRGVLDNRYRAHLRGCGCRKRL